MPSFIIPAPPRSGGTAHRRLWSHPLRDEMDPYTPRLHDLGLCATIGKSRRSPEVVEAIRRNGAVYLCAVGGAGTLAARSVVSCEVIAFEDLGCEAVKAAGNPGLSSDRRCGLPWGNLFAEAKNR